MNTLREQSRGWWHFANDRLHHEAAEAAQALEAGATSVRVGHTTYEVTSPEQ